MEVTMYRDPKNGWKSVVEEKYLALIKTYKVTLGSVQEFVRTLHWGEFGTISKVSQIKLLNNYISTRLS